MVKIDKDVPIPTTAVSQGKTPKYPWYEMEVGDSFLLEGNFAETSPYSLSSNASERYAPKKFMTRKTPAGFRIWRTK